MKKLGLAFGFLTRFPSGRGSADGAPEDFSGSVLFYFAPALAVGAVGSAVWWAIGFLGVPCLGALGYVVAEALATGALHMDGFADVCDAFLCAAPPQRRLEILRDSRLGTFGVVGVAFDIGCRILLIGALPAGAGTLGILCALPVLGKASLILCAASSRSARPDGLGRAFLSGLRTRDCVVAIVLCAVLALALMGWLRGVLCLGAALLAGLAMRSAAYREIGGVTGDVLGACNELGEIASLIVCAAARMLAQEGWPWT